MDSMIQINITIPRGQKKQLERLARIYSVEEDNNITYTELIRRAIQEKYDLTNDDTVEKDVQSEFVIV